MQEVIKQLKAMLNQLVYLLSKIKHDQIDRIEHGMGGDGRKQVVGLFIKPCQRQRQREQWQKRSQIEMDQREDGIDAEQGVSWRTKLFDEGIQNSAKEKFLGYRRNHDGEQSQVSEFRPAFRFFEQGHRRLRFG